MDRFDLFSSKKPYTFADRGELVHSIMKCKTEDHVNLDAAIIMVNMIAVNNQTGADKFAVLTFGSRSLSKGCEDL